jgi:hypothetical protein
MAYTNMAECVEYSLRLWIELEARSNNVAATVELLGLQYCMSNFLLSLLAILVVSLCTCVYDVMFTVLQY